MAFTAAGAAKGAPPELYDRPHWFACYTRARAEKRVSELLAERGIDSYVPLIELERQWKDRIKKVKFPLFPSYVFARFPLESIHQVLSVPGVSTVVRLGGHPAAIPDEEIDNVRRFAEGLGESGLEPEPRPLLGEGQRVEVTEGPFRGVRGVVTERRGRSRVLVGLGAIGQGLEVDIDAALLRRL